MPRKPKTPCRYPGCPALCEGRYCDQHQPIIDHDYNTRHRDREASRFYSSDRWRKLRAAKLSRTPLCEECARQGKTTAATMVDHIQPIKQGGRALDMDNLQSLCWSCHSAKSIKEGSRFGRR
ncbi:MAG: HNH endonuclease [Oscillospiraceae bacterium]|nr:HNH endonuclease [Oscillospiraceae bacterium]